MLDGHTLPTIRPIPALTAILACTIIAIADGDTLTARCDDVNIKIRVAEIDAPEKGQGHAQQAAPGQAVPQQAGSGQNTDARPLWPHTAASTRYRTKRESSVEDCGETRIRWRHGSGGSRGMVDEDTREGEHK